MTFDKTPFLSAFDLGFGVPTCDPSAELPDSMESPTGAALLAAAVAEPFRDISPSWYDFSEQDECLAVSASNSCCASGSPPLLATVDTGAAGHNVSSVRSTIHLKKRPSASGSDSMIAYSIFEAPALPSLLDVEPKAARKKKRRGSCTPPGSAQPFSGISTNTQAEILHILLLLLILREKLAELTLSVRSARWNAFALKSTPSASTRSKP